MHTFSDCVRITILRRGAREITADKCTEKKSVMCFINEDQEVHLVLYSSWSSPSGGDCMTLVANGYWMATDCTKRLQYVMCEGEVNNTITSSSSLNWWSPGGLVGIVIGVIRKKQAENTIRGGVTNSVVTGYPEAHERGPVMTPPDLMAYRAERSEADVISYNDANHTYEHLSSPAPPSEYTLITNPRSGHG
ncbi:hypothetical protein LSH36_2011g00000 [Paralvinella palmiformis]|uniref:C-type lectin domain-containing protein n=1 Tax=Paralvinella palmiformis TaxID=53620 RepID=A0AAD9ML67_9ANNE|nr:hypothetical protein LSH36_2011g00000 [Paralvinella palmiformis]